MVEPAIEEAVLEKIGKEAVLETVEEVIIEKVPEQAARQTSTADALSNFITATISPIQDLQHLGSLETKVATETAESVEITKSSDDLSLFEQIAVFNIEDTDYASQDIFASIDAEGSNQPKPGDLTELALFQAPPEQGSFDPYPDSTIEAPGETLLAMGEILAPDEDERYPSSSGEFGKHDPAPDPNDPPRGIFGGKKGISLFNTNPFSSTSEDVITGLSVNSFLWRATLDTLAFMPLESADPFGGVIITDWHNNPQVPDERFKVVAYILDKDLRVGALRVSVFRQEKDAEGDWDDAVTDENVHIQLETTILSRARDLRAAWIKQQEGG